MLCYLILVHLQWINNARIFPQIHLMAFQSVEEVQLLPLQWCSLFLNTHHFCNHRLRFQGYMNQEMTMYLTLRLQNGYPPPKCSVRNSVHSPSIPSPFSGMFTGPILPPSSYSSYTFVSSTHLFEYSFIIVSVISIGHISTVALAAATLGSMTASVTGYSIVQGFASTLDTLLPPAWTSVRPRMVGLWTQRMGQFFFLHSP